MANGPPDASQTSTLISPVDVSASLEVYGYSSGDPGQPQRCFISSSLTFSMAVSGRYFACTASSDYTVVPTTCFVTARGCDNVNVQYCKRCRLLDIDADFACMPIHVYANPQNTEVALTGWGCNSVGTTMTVYITPTTAFGVDPSAIQIWSSADSALAALSSQMSLGPPITSAPTLPTSSGTDVPALSGSNLSETSKIALGVGLGLGIPLLLVSIAILFLLLRRNRREPQINTIGGIETTQGY